jgi:hypothetical protein
LGKVGTNELGKLRHRRSRPQNGSEQDREFASLERSTKFQFRYFITANVSVVCVIGTV